MDMAFYCVWKISFQFDALVIWIGEGLFVSIRLEFLSKTFWIDLLQGFRGLQIW